MAVQVDFNVYYSWLSVIERIKGHFLYVDEIPRDLLESTDPIPPVEWLKELNKLEKRIIVHMLQGGQQEGLITRVAMIAFFSVYEGSYSEYKCGDIGGAPVWLSSWRHTIRQIFQEKIKIWSDYKEKFPVDATVLFKEIKEGVKKFTELYGSVAPKTVAFIEQKI